MEYSEFEEVTDSEAEDYDEEVVEIDEDGNEVVVEYVFEDEEVEEESAEGGGPLPDRAFPKTPNPSAKDVVASVKETGPAADKQGLGGLGKRLKKIIKKRPIKKGQKSAETEVATASATTTTKGHSSPEKTKKKKLRKVQMKKESPTTGDTDPAPAAAGAEETEEDPKEPKLVYTLTVVKDDKGDEISREETGKAPPRFAPPHQQKRYVTKKKIRSRVTGFDRKKTVEEITMTYEKPGPFHYEANLPASALRATTERNPARKTTEWEKPVWAKNNVFENSTCGIYSGANLEKPITSATTNKKGDSGSFSFSVER